MQKLFIVLLLYIFNWSAGLASSYIERSDVQKFIDEFSTQHSYPKPLLSELMSGVQKQTDVLEAIQRPAEKKKNWQEYRKIFITDKRIQAGLKFWSENAQILAAAEREYGVPPEIIVSIVGVETFYGKYKGKYRVLDSLVTLGFDYPPRQNFFRSELEHFLLLTLEEDIDPITVKGSYAGAMGKSQFISSSYRQYAVDFDDNGKRDLWGSNEDVIGSIANYFVKNGWKESQPISIPANITGNRYQELLDKGMRPKARFSELAQYDVEAATEFEDHQKVALLEFNNNTSNEYWIGFHNFYVITRYNHSSMYAMAVYQLSQQIKHDIQDYVAQH